MKNPIKTVLVIVAASATCLISLRAIEPREPSTDPRVAELAKTIQKRINLRIEEINRTLDNYHPRYASLIPTTVVDGIALPDGFACMELVFALQDVHYLADEIAMEAVRIERDYGTTPWHVADAVCSAVIGEPSSEMSQRAGRRRSGRKVFVESVARWNKKERRRYADRRARLPRGTTSLFEDVIVPAIREGLEEGGEQLVNIPEPTSTPKERDKAAKQALHQMLNAVGPNSTRKPASGRSQRAHDRALDRAIDSKPEPYEGSDIQRGERISRIG